MAAPHGSRTRRGVVLVVGSAAGAGSTLRAFYDVRIAMGGAQALELAATTPGPDLVLLDADAPGVDGASVCRTLRRGPRTRFIPIVVVAAKTTALADEIEDLADEVLPKPIDDDALVARVERAIAASGQDAGTEGAIQPGTIVGEHRLERKLGSGAAGDVYAAAHVETGHRVAVKVLALRSAAQQPEHVARFVAEAKAANRIQQRNIIEVFSFGVLEQTGRHYYVMELLEGETLRALLGRVGRLSLVAAIPILQGIADGLDAAHAAGVTHRDLKPDNVFLVRLDDGATLPKILDFGIAKLAGDDAAHRTRSGIVLGTPRYMSPEQARGRAITPKADVYALGVMIHEMLTGSAPFRGPALDVLLQHATDAPPPASSVCADVPAAIDAVILAMLAKRPEDRPASAGAAVAAIVVAAQGAP
jgi:eukaryotic-like serine/threonine-protein kinase